MTDRKPTRLDLPEDQKTKVKAVTGQDASAVELQSEELEQRVAPIRL